MRNHTIWESASRPLFVRTVWLEGSELRRGLQRHFLLDYDTKIPLERLNSASDVIQQKQTGTLKHSISLELNDFTDFDAFNAVEAEVMLVGSAKVKLHEPFKLTRNKKSKVVTTYRRASLSHSRTYPTYSAGPTVELEDKSLRKNSETADELLAERVLHWLDLAGKENFLKNLHELKTMEVKLSKASKLRQDAIRRYSTKEETSLKSKHHKRKNYSRVSTVASRSTNPKTDKCSEAVKHITIIFNQEGQPIRLNRPAKNIDLCALSASASTTRRLAGSLASARLYKNSRCVNAAQTSSMNSKIGNEGNKSLSEHRRLDTVADLTNCTLQKRLQGSCNNLYDSKKQLHIFMPTLPKKGFIQSGAETEDAVSDMSHKFSELCRI